MRTMLRRAYGGARSARHEFSTTGDQFAIMTDSGPRWTGKVELIESKLTRTPALAQVAAGIRQLDERSVP